MNRQEIWRKRPCRSYPDCWTQMRVVFSLYSKTHPRASRDYLRRMKHLPKNSVNRSQFRFFTNDELVTFARSYSRELGYKIDDMAVLALYNRISNIQRLDQATTLTEVKDIVDEAIHREAHGGLKKAISILTASRYTDDDRIVLTEKDFE